MEKYLELLLDYCTKMVESRFKSLEEMRIYQGTLYPPPILNNKNLYHIHTHNDEDMLSFINDIDIERLELNTTLIAHKQLPLLLNMEPQKCFNIRSITRVDIKTDIPLYIHYDYKSEEFNKLLKGN